MSSATTPGNRSSAESEAATAASAWHYRVSAIPLHWSMALLLIAMSILGFCMVSVEDEPGSVWFFDTHNSVGLIMAFVIAVRVAWRLMNRPEALPAAVPAWQRRLASVTQAMLYAMMVLMPLTGYLGSSYGTAGVELFGVATPQWTLPDQEKANLFFSVHSTLIWVLMITVVVHLVGALRHLFIARDGVFQRMWFRRRRGGFRVGKL